MNKNKHMELYDSIRVNNTESEKAQIKNQKPKRILTISGPVTKEMVTEKTGINNNSDCTKPKNEKLDEPETANLMENGAVVEIQPENKVGTLFKGKVNNKLYADYSHRVSYTSDYRSKNRYK